MKREIKIGDRVRLLPNPAIGRAEGIVIAKYPHDDWYRILITHHADQGILHTIRPVPPELCNVLPRGKPTIYDAPKNHIGDITITLTERERDYLTECIARVLDEEPRPLKLIKLLNKIAGLNDPDPVDKHNERGGTNDKGSERI